MTLDSGGIDRIVLGMCAHETHEPDSMRVVEADDESVPVPADVEYNPVPRVSVSLFHVSAKTNPAIAYHDFSRRCAMSALR